MMIDRSLLQVPTAMCVVRSPLFSGRVEVLCLEDPVCDLIIGNVAGVQPIELCPTHREYGLQSKEGMPEKGCDYLVPYETIIPQFISCESPSLVEKVERNHEEGSVDQSRDTVKSVVQGCAVETRASAMKPRIVKPLVVQELWWKNLLREVLRMIKGRIAL